MVTNPLRHTQKERNREGAAHILSLRLIKEEGLLIGGSSGSAVWAALQAAKQLKKGQGCLVLLPDSIRNYLTKFVDTRWMQQEGYINNEKTKILD